MRCVFLVSAYPCVCISTNDARRVSVSTCAAVFTVKIRFGCARLASCAYCGCSCGRSAGVAVDAERMWQAPTKNRNSKFERSPKKRWKSERGSRAERGCGSGANSTLYNRGDAFPVTEREKVGESESKRFRARERVRASQLIVVSVCFTMLFALWTLHSHFPQNIYRCT